MCLATPSVAQDFTEDLQKLQWSYKLISSFYVDSVDNKKLVEDAIVGMLTNLDPHSELAASCGFYPLCEFSSYMTEIMCR